eukprot:189406_1
MSKTETDKKIKGLCYSVITYLSENLSNNDLSAIDLKSFNKPWMQLIKKQNINVITIYKINKHYKRNTLVYESILKTMKNKNEMILFHGTKLKNIDKIIYNGFNSSYNVRSKYGKGTYFTNNPSTAALYSDLFDIEKGYFTILVCRVIIGKCGLAKTCHKNINDKRNTMYDSMVNNLQNPSIFVINKDYHAIPIYIVVCQRYNGNYNANNKVSNNNYTHLNQKKIIYKFKSGEKFLSFSYLVPQKITSYSQYGPYTVVSSAINTHTQKKYAIKKYPNVFVNISNAKLILREIKLMYHFQGHPNLISIIDVIPPDTGTQQKFKDVYLIMPKMHMTLSKLIMKSSIGKLKLYECDVQTIMYQIFRGLEYMHSGGVIHRNIKPENILINCYFHKCNDPNCNIINKHLWQARITDFSLVRGINDNKSNVLTNSVAQYYRAPEILSLVCCNGLCDCQIDVWSLACIFGEMYYKKPLFRGNNHLHQLQVIFYYCGTPNDLEWVKMDDGKQWIKQLQKYNKKDFQKEFSFYSYCNNDQQIINDIDDKCGIMSKIAVDLLTQLLICDPKKK